MTRLLAVLCSLWMGAALAAAPQQVAATYSLTKQGQQIGTVTESFKQTEGRYQLESVTSAIGVYALFMKGKIRLVSSGEVTGHGLRPRHFEHHRAADPAKTVQADFDWEKMSLTHHFDGRTESVALEPGTQDRISLQYQFMFAPPDKEDIQLFMTTGKKLNLYHYKLAGEERITTPAGQFQAIHLVKQRNADEDGTEIWLAKKRHYFPVRIVIEEHHGGKLEQNLTSLTFEGEL
ncbi:MAG: DUF3108 domain-containing protein [Hydrogenophilales bacterium CG_4_10_14_3_um_filter_58_23]|nr:MAG: hypothetical protein COW70_07495 [Hydrogenophilales bacterium CG18_big_fil_WC_8_21_14_2_50_58_12]PIY00221.1 MAG: DUF3108 domain-containing protein [Hydrogenophilales bacterium CG_4_10_14_3_um_filter_58_23]